MKYRADIDGLRTIAVVPVVLFHVGIMLFPGGFIGVDVFFVISGYLITKIIYGKITEGEFSISEFYRKRIDRLLPVLISVLLFCTIIGWVVNTPDEYSDLAKSIFSAVFFISNIFFFWTEDYFSASSFTIPLLHTWSLGVEEQFYIFFPLALSLSLFFQSKKMHRK
ncbi:acyltransferase family protein [Halotalea alkalilenta]|uniref:acyltransferase family protein n=1 Tax=Halotalea alkalilenta TaxID=376489 RepID=UPI0009ED1BEB|nr:acyltransferase [Halotalea alkalilenta]